jgi:hypothetical protein
MKLVYLFVFKATNQPHQRTGIACNETVAGTRMIMKLRIQYPEIIYGESVEQEV